MTTWICRICGQEEVSETKPSPVRWANGHVCYFEEKEEE